MWRHSVHNPENIYEWERLIFNVLDTERSEESLRRLGLWDNVRGAADTGAAALTGRRLRNPCSATHKVTTGLPSPTTCR